MNERDWKLLLLLYEQGSITKAANLLHVTQPALSTRLKQIEEFFGVQIVIRGKKGVQFTAEGEYLARKARAVLADLDDARNTLDSMKKSTAGTLRIGASHFFTRYLLPPLLGKFKNQHPAVEYRVRTGWSRETVRQLLNNDIHVAFVREEHSWTGIKRLLFSEDLLAVYSHTFALEDLPRLPLIHFMNEPSHQMLIDNWWAEHFTVPSQVGMVVDRLDTCLAMIKAGLGYGFLPAWILRGVEGLHAKKMRYRTGAPVERSTWMILKEETATLRLVQEFLDMVDDTDFASLQYS